MAEEKEYKYQINGDVFERVMNKNKALNAYDGVSILTGGEIYDEFGDLFYLQHGDNYLVIRDTEFLDYSTRLRGKQSESLQNLVLINSKIRQLVFDNCLFSGNGQNLNSSSLLIYNCVVDTVSIINCQMGDFNVIGSEVNAIDLEGGMLGDLMIEQNIIDALRINNLKAGNITIHKGQITYSSIYNAQTGCLDVYDSLILDTSIYKGIVDAFQAFGSTLGPLVIEKSELDTLTIEESKIGRFHFYYSRATELSISHLFAPVAFSNAAVGQCKLNDCYISELRVENECDIELYISNGVVNHLNLKQLTLGKNSVVSFSSVEVHTCNMDNFAMLGYFYFRNIKKAPKIVDFFEKEGKRPQFSKGRNLHWLNYYDKLKNYRKEINELRLLNKLFNPTFRISQSSLGRTEFTECDLAAFNFEYNNSKITEIFISGGTIPKDIIVYNETNVIKILEQKKSFFDQLKKVFEGQGDLVRGTHYHAKTSEIQMQIIEAGKRKWWFKYFDTEWWVFKLNEASNRHGESWGWAVLFTLGISLVGFIFYNHALLNIKYEFVHEWNTDWLGDWAQFILPTHKMEFMDENPSSSAKFIDVLFRIFIGYGIYQLISAFRKHGKKV